MKIPLIFLSLFSFYSVHSQEYQYGVQPNVFDTFIRRSSIEWAAYSDDTIRFNNPNLSDILITRMEKSEIKTAYRDIRFSSFSPYFNPFILSNFHYTTKDENHMMFYRHWTDYMYDSHGNVIIDSGVKKQERRIDDVTKDLLWITQILYVEDGVLKSYIPWVAPTCSRIMEGYFSEVETYFASCLNFKYDFISRTKDKNIFLGKTKRKFFIDTAFKTETLKQTYSRSLLQSIWVNVIMGKTDIYNIKTNEKILTQALPYFTLSSKPLVVSMYDSLGNEIGKKYRDFNPIPYYITEFEIVQQWYYNYTKNIVTCKIAEMFLYAGRDDNNVPVKADKPVLKIVF